MSDGDAFDPPKLIARLAAFPPTLEAIVADTRDGEWTWRPHGGGWAIAEVLGHLLREEREDFRVRLVHTLERPGEAWPQIDPEGDVERHRDIDADPALTLAGFRAERSNSVAWLRGLGGGDPARADWDASYEHPRLGVFRAGDLLSAWADHDALHARQLIKRRHQLTVRDAGGFSCRYAGDWTA